MDDFPFDDTVADGLPNDVLGVFLRIEVKLHADVAQGYARVR
jgi:hypothetical protein